MEVDTIGTAPETLQPAFGAARSAAAASGATGGRQDTALVKSGLDSPPDSSLPPQCGEPVPAHQVRGIGQALST